MKSYTYKDAGVDIIKADNLIEKLKKDIQGTFNPLVLNPIGGFGSLTEIPAGLKHPILVTSTDGVGTKLKIAFLTGKHDTVGIDLVAMCANDILTLGAKPYFFLDYYACGKIDENTYSQVIKGICNGCVMADCALIGGETAEMPSFYKEGEYDLAGFVIGFAEKEKIIDGTKIHEGDTIIGLPSNGLHSNGFSLVRKVFFELHNINIDNVINGLEVPLYEELLKPTKIYVRPILNILKEFNIKGMAHITGGGLPGNIKRIIPDGLKAKITIKKDNVPEIFHIIKNLGNVPQEDMFSTFNMGIGFVLITESKDAEPILDILKARGEKGSLIGNIERSEDKEKVIIEYLT